MQRQRAQAVSKLADKWFVELRWLLITLLPCTGYYSLPPTAVTESTDCIAATAGSEQDS